MITFKKSGPSTLLGLKINGQRVHAVVVRRAQDSLQLEKATDFNLTLNLLKDNPEHVGAELHQHLENAGIKTTHCVACIPLSWVMTLQTELPDLPPEDMQSFLDIQSEREFPFPPEDLSLSLSEYHGTEGQRFATLGAIPRKKIDTLCEVFSAANLKLASISVGIPAMCDLEKIGAAGEIDLLVGENSIDLQVVAGGGITALRTLEDIDPTQQDWDATAVSKEIRITYGELSEEIRSSIQQINVFGSSDLVTAAMDRLGPLLGRLGVSVERGVLPDAKVSTMLAEIQSVCPSIVGLVIQQLSGTAPAFEFLPPRVSKFKELSDRFSSGRNVWLGSAAAAIFLITFVSFQVQGWRLSSLEDEWQTIGSDVKELKEVQAKIRYYRDWFDQSANSLIIAKHLTEAFPETGDVWLTSLKMESQNKITCTATARSSRAWATVRDKLNSMEQISELKTPTQNPNEGGLNLQFSFVWNGGRAQ